MEVEEETEETKMRPNDENVDDDRVVGDDDDRLREQAEERVRAQQERNNRYPKWAQPLEIGIKKMPEAYEGVSNIDPDEVSPQILDNTLMVSPQIFDNTLMVYIAGYYDAYYKYRTETNAETRYEWTVNQTDRLDIDKLGPMNGFEDDGSLRPPTTSTLRPWFDRKAKPVAVLENEMMWEDRPFDAMLLMIETALKVEKIMAFLVETGLSPKDINYYMPTVEDKADASRRARMRRIISNFIARSIKGAYPEVSTYTYFRDQDDVRDYGASCLRLPAVGVYYMIRKRYRNLDVAIIAAQCGVRLPKVLQLQVDYAWAKAMADNARGKSQRLHTLMPSAPERVDYPTTNSHTVVHHYVAPLHSAHYYGGHGYYYGGKGDYGDGYKDGSYYGDLGHSHGYSYSSGALPGSDISYGGSYDGGSYGRGYSGSYHHGYSSYGRHHFSGSYGHGAGYHYHHSYHSSKDENGIHACSGGHAHQCPADWKGQGSEGGYHCLHQLARQTSHKAYLKSGGACRPAAHGPFPVGDCQVQCRIGGNARVRRA
eukprot:s4905_g3.t1